MRLQAAVITLALLVGSCSAVPTAIDYRVTPVLDGHPHLSIEIRLRGDASGLTRLHFEDWGREARPWAAAQNVKITGATTDGAPGQVRILHHRPNQPIIIRYDVVQPGAAAPSGEDLLTLFRPVIQPDWFSAYGEAAFAYPEGREKSAARFHWGTAPQGWTLTSNLDDGAPQTVDGLRHSFLVGGRDLRILNRKIDGGQVRLVTRGRWTFEDGQIADAVAGIVQAERRFWGDKGGDFFAPVLPVEAPPDVTAVRGTGTTAGFVLFSTPNASLTKLRQLIAHETMHSWIPGQLGDDREGDDEFRDKWFGEGFTDFYAWRVLLRSGLYGLDDYARDLNGVLRRYALSPVNTLPNSQIPPRHESDANVEQLPYDRGDLFAALIDGEIRTRTRGQSDLDDVLFAQRKIAATSGVRRPATDLFAPAILSAGDFDAAPLIKRYPLDGQRIWLPSDLFGECARVETVTLYNFDPGFDSDATWSHGGELQKVDRKGPAYAAGLRDGMRLLNHRTGSEDPEVASVYRVAEQGVVRVVSYFPRGRRSFPGQRVVLKPRMSAGEAQDCARRMSGG